LNLAELYAMLLKLTLDFLRIPWVYLKAYMVYVWCAVIRRCTRFSSKLPVDVNKINERITGSKLSDSIVSRTAFELAP